MTDLTPAAFQRRLAAEFEVRGWHYDLNIGRTIVEEIDRRGNVDPAEIAKAVPGEFLARANATREDVADAIDAAAGGQNIKRESPSASVVINDNRYQVNLSGKSQINDSKLNVGDGTQINVDVSADRREVLAVLEALLRSGLNGDWNNAAAADLAEVIDHRDDIEIDDVRQLTTDVARAEQPKQGRAREFLGKVAASGLGGALATGISAGLGEIISQLPL